MIPKVARKGSSFVGAGLYYLHDKGTSTKARVAFTYTENLPTRDADKAIKCMAYTAIRQQQIKARAGGSAKGRKLTQPVYCYSLSWYPGEDPSLDQMVAAAQETLKELGLSGHEALFVVHNDEPHPHIHVIANRVHPETGIAAPLKKDFLKLSAWAEKFERLQGKIVCEQRVENNELRRRGRFVKDRDSQHSAEYHRWRLDRLHTQYNDRAVESAVVNARQEREREQLRNERDRQLAGLRTRAREATRADWRDLFTIQRRERARLDDAQRSVFGRVRFFIKTYREEFKAARKSARKEMFKSAFAAVFKSKAQYRKLDEKQKKERIFFASKLRDRVKPIIEKIRAKHENDLLGLKQKQNAESKQIRSRHLEQRRRDSLERYQGRDREIFQQERREKRQQELQETKKDILKGPAQPQARPNSLSAQFGTANPRVRKASGKITENKEPTVPEQVPSGESIPRTDRAAAFREQAEDVTEKREVPKTRGGLAAQFSRVKDTRTAEKEPIPKRDAFKENAQDIGHSSGRRPGISKENARPNRGAEYREQAKDVTEKRKRAKTTGLAEQFNRTKEAKGDEKQLTPKKTLFRENAQDVSRGRSRERDKKPKPPSGWKPT
jgi:Relaxase/Mobilisation nuclease domain